MQYTDEELSKLHDTLYEILHVVDEICRKHDIKYFVTGGTAIGVHFWQGIIPWDDDIDIGMTRRNYERFLAVAQQEMGDKYFLQTPDTDAKIPFFFAKVRKNNTVFSESQFKSVNMHQGIYVDIFPFDDIPLSARLQKLQHEVLFFLNGLLISKEIWQYEHCGRCEVDTPRKRGFLACLMTRIIISCVTKKTLLRMINRVQTWFNGKGYEECKNIITRSEHLTKYNAENPELRTLGPLQIYAPRDIVTYLLNHYGKIQKDCPPEMRVNHRPAELVF